MSRYYTRACNFYYGKKSKTLVRKKKSIPLNGNKELSFDSVEIISRKSKKKFLINNLDNLLIENFFFDFLEITSI